MAKQKESKPVSEPSGWARMQEQRRGQQPLSPTDRTIRQNRGIFGDYDPALLATPTLARYEKALSDK